MVWALVHQDREIERHSSKEACVIAAFERGWVMRSRGGLFLLEGVTLRHIAGVDCQQVEPSPAPKAALDDCPLGELRYRVELCPRHPKDCACWQAFRKDRAHG